MPMQFPPDPIDGASGAGINGGHRPTVVPAPDAPSPEISPRPRRRSFTAQDKQRILAETDRTAGTGQIGALHARGGPAQHDRQRPDRCRPQGRDPSS